MADQRVWTASELLAMSPGERHDVVTAGFVTDPGAVPPELLEQARQDIAAHIATASSDPDR